MSDLKLLIDTNVFIGLEDHGKVDPAAAEIVRKSSEFGVHIFIHEAAVRDIARDRDAARRENSLSKIRKFQELKGPTLPSRRELEKSFGPIRKPNDEVDVTLLYALQIEAVDLLVTEDQGIHDRVKLTTLARRVLTIEDALEWLRRTFDPSPVSLPLVDEKKAHEIDPQDQIFDSLREGYPGFDDWWREKCVRQHRRCWTVTIDEQLAGLVVRKDESHSEARTKNGGPKILKICTFKVRPEFRGEKLGELLLKQALWFAQRNSYDLVYLTTYPNQAFLIQVLEFYGFEHTQTHANGEMVLEKPLSRSKLTAGGNIDVFTLDRLNYPRFVADHPANVFCVPIKGAYHQKLFPEIAIAGPLPLFPYGGLLSVRGDRHPGNTIRKVYLCRAKTTALKPGDVLLFYQSKTPGLAASQSLTTVGVIEVTSQTTDLQELTRLTAKRSVFSERELQSLLKQDASPVRVIDFLLTGHIDPPIPLHQLVTSGVFRGRPPQSICLLRPERFAAVRDRIQLGFEI